ncbi:right-handed parallel beta-helix repeat-containing protein [Ruania alba]|uniref:Pectate lyase superfamily protein n=1 Tax=Ruania alba TaxID=648782 RepID=A0A1H5M988_9MICO|nr:right-handed parallel beta-helix repeat-containing protein [Ruania alba]SEE85842.1 Pectate lyase superfamily protein [Ruania alba]
MSRTTSASPAPAPVSRGAFLAAVGASAVAGVSLVGSRAHATPPPSSTSTSTTGVVNVRDHGAVGDGVTDDSAAFQQALDAIVAAEEGCLYVPPGNYLFDHRVTVTAGRLNVSIVGAGQGVSNLFSDNSDGVLSIETGRQGQVTVTDLSFFSMRAGGGTALEAIRPIGDRHNRTMTIRNVEMRGVALNNDYFDYGLRAISQVNPLVTNVIFAGPFAGGVNRDRTDDSLLYAATCGIFIDECYAPVVENCYVWSAFTGYRLVTERTEPAPEGGWFYNCSAVGVRVGFEVRTPNSLEPGTAIERCHANGRDIGIHINRAQFTITNCLLYNSLPGDDFTPETAPEYTDILVESGWLGTISHNIFRQPFNLNRTGVRIADQQNDVTGDPSHLLISGNHFTSPGTAISVAPNATRVNVTGNMFHTEPDPYNGTPLVATILDDPAGAVAFSSDELRAVTALAEQSQQVPDAEWTTVQWHGTELDTAGFWNSSEPDSITIPAGQGVRYVKVIASVGWESSPSGVRELQILRNSEPVTAGSCVQDKGVANTPGSGDVDMQTVHTAIVPVSGGDIIQARVRQTSGDALTLDESGRTSLSVETVNG